MASESALSIDRSKYRLPDNQYVVQKTEKTGIVLHFTSGGTVAGAFNGWVATPERVGTSYIVDRAGVAYEAFDPDYWAYHLGSNVAKEQSQRTIGIEMVNWGPLKLKKDTQDLYAWPENYTRTRICSLLDTHLYVKREYRDAEYYSLFPDAQVASVVKLCLYLCDRYKISMRIPNSERRLLTMETVNAFMGVMAHNNYRADKYDMGPAWPWQKMIEAGFVEENN